MDERPQVHDLVERLSAGLTQCAMDNFGAGVALVERRGEVDPARLLQLDAAATRAEETFGEVFDTLVQLADTLGVPRERLRSSPRAAGEDVPRDGREAPPAR